MKICRIFEQSKKNIWGSKLMKKLFMNLFTNTLVIRKLFTQKLRNIFINVGKIPNKVVMVTDCLYICFWIILYRTSPRIVFWMQWFVLIFKSKIIIINYPVRGPESRDFQNKRHNGKHKEDRIAYKNSPAEKSSGPIDLISLRLANPFSTWVISRDTIWLR